MFSSCAWSAATAASSASAVVAAVSYCWCETNSLLHQRRVAVDVALGVGELRLVPRELRLHLLHLRRRRARVEPEHHVAGLDVLAVLDQDAVDVSVDARLDR